MEKASPNRRKYYSDREYNYHSNLIEEYEQYELNSSIYLYKYDRVNTPKPNLYGEVENEDKALLPKIEINCRYNILEDEAEYEKGFNYKEKLTIEFSVLEKTLRSLNLEIDNGDFVRVHSGTEDGDLFFEINQKLDLGGASTYTKNFRQMLRQYKGIIVRDDQLIKTLYQSDHE